MDAAIRTEDLRKVYAVAGSKWLRSAGDVNFAGGPAGLPARPGNGAPGEIVALQGLKLEVRKGEFFGLLGPNGAGKTTTIGILTTRVRPTAGRAFVAGADVVKDEVLVKQRIGVVPQWPNPDRSLNVRENLVFHASYFGIGRSDAVARANELLRHLDIADRADSKVDKLSGGQQQRLMIARALIHEPEVLFLDEPTVGLDPQARLSLWGILRDLHSRGRTIVMTTHYMEEADRLCERIAIIDGGKLLAVDTPARLKSQAPGGTLVELTLDGDPSATADAVRGIPGVLKVEGQGSVLRVYSERGGEVIPLLIRASEQAGRTVRDIHLSPPSLETLFISLTGRKLV
jgi:ABC-2 type transport system ATP-binding protein